MNIGLLSLAQRAAESWLGVAVVSANSTPFFSKQMLQSLKLSQSLSSSPQWHFSCLELGGEYSLFSLSMEHGPSCGAPFMNMHEIRYDIALLPLIILSSDLSSRKLQSMACRTNVAWRQTRGKGHLFRHLFLFDWDRGFQHLGILLRVARGRVEGGKWAGLSMNGLACWQPGAVGVMVCEVTLYIGTVGSPSFFVKEAFAGEVWVSGLPVINHHSPFFSLTAQYKAWHLTPKTPDFCTDTSWGPKGGEEGKRKRLSWFL